MESYLEHLKKTQNVLSSKEVAQENKKTGGPSPGCSNTGFVEDGVEDIGNVLLFYYVSVTLIGHDIYVLNSIVLLLKKFRF